MLTNSELKIQMQSVSKCKKQRSINHKKNQHKHTKYNNIQLINDYDHRYHPPTIQQYYCPSNLSQHNDIDNTIKCINTDPHLITQYIQQVFDYFKNKYQGAQKQESDEYYQLRDFEDSNLTKHISEQILILKILMMMMAILSMFLVHLRYEIRYAINEDLVEDMVLIGQTIISISLGFTHIIIHFLSKQLTQKQLIKFSIYHITPYGINWVFILELVYLLIHPNLIFKDITIQMYQPANNQYIQSVFNDLLQIIILTRIYLLYSALITSSIFMSTRANRVCRIYGTNCDYIFGMKCVFNETPLSALAVMFLSLLLVLAEMVRLCEQNSQSSGLGIFGNSLWCVIITMGTVGYGDYYPITYLGRLIVFMASISGIILSSLLILTLSTYLSMQLSQIKSHITLQRLKIRQTIQQSASAVIKQTALLHLSSKSQEQKNPQMLKSLKKKAQDVKYMMRKIKNLVDTNNINQEMDRLFESLGDNVKQAYLNQCKYAQALIKLVKNQQNRIQDMKFSFTEEIQNVIKDR